MGTGNLGLELRSILLGLELRSKLLLLVMIGKRREQRWSNEVLLVMELTRRLRWQLNGRHHLRWQHL